MREERRRREESESEKYTSWKFMSENMLCSALLDKVTSLTSSVRPFPLTRPTVWDTKSDFLD